MITVPGRLRDPGCPSRSRPVLYRAIDLMAPEPCDNKASDLYGPRSSLRLATKADASWREASSSPICAARTSGGISSRSASIYSAARAMRQAPTARAEPLREWAAWHQPCAMWPYGVAPDTTPTVCKTAQGPRAPAPHPQACSAPNGPYRPAPPALHRRPPILPYRPAAHAHQP